MTEDTFNYHCRLQHGNIWQVMTEYEGKKFDPSWIKALSNDLNQISRNLDELCEIYEMENKTK